MKNFASTLILFLCSLLLLPFSSFGQGSLTPPGAPAPTMKTLDQVEARTPIDATNTPGDADTEFTITQPGSYYLTRNVDVTKTTGITVEQPGVTIDLNGFEIRRTGGTGGSGIFISPVAARCTVKNGSVAGFAVGIDSPGIFFLSPAEGGSFSYLRFTGCSSFGLRAGIASMIENCEAVRNGGTGIFAAIGSTIRDCTARANVGTGIEASAGSVIERCAASNNDATGLLTDVGGLVTQSTARDNGGDGISVGNGSTVQGCSAFSNTFNDIIARSGCTVARNSVMDGAFMGIRVVGSGSHVLENTVRDHKNQPGIQIDGGDNRIEGNVVNGNQLGIRVTQAGNLIIKNSSSSNPVPDITATANNYTIVPGNYIGKISTPSAGSSGTNPGLGADAATAWANFSF